MRELILRLARPVMRLLGRDERGGIGVIVAMMIGCGVLLGIGALVIDVGQLYQNRAELQNGADAGALAVASSCVHGSCSAAIAGTYATGNASGLTDHEAADQVCGLASAGFAGCTGPMAGCPPAPANGANWVDVLDSTLTGDNPSDSTKLPPFFARTLLGNGSYNGTNVQACAQAEWGPAGQADSLAFTLSLCVWNGLGANPDGTEIALVEHGSAKACALAPSGLNLPGGFGWLQTDSSSSCDATITLSPPPATTYVAESKPGNNITGACQAALQNDINTVVFLPIFSDYSGGGNNGTYTLAGLAAFYLNGYVNMKPLNDAVPPGMTDQQAQNLCSAGSTKGGNGASDRCLLGYFTTGIVPVTNSIRPPGNGDFGAEGVQLTG